MIHLHDPFCPLAGDMAAYVAGNASKLGDSVHYTYDALGRQISFADSTGTTTTTYDPITQQIASVTNPEGVIHYVYDPATGRHIQTYSNSTDLRYSYDELGRLKTVAAYKLGGMDFSSSPQTTTYTYTADGALASVKLPSGIETDYRYDSLNRLVQETIEKIAGAIATLMQSYNYTLQSDGNRTSSLEVTYGNTGTVSSADLIQWNYDALDRLTSETRSSVDPTTINNVNPTVTALEYSDNYTLGLTGNRLQKVHVDANTSKNEIVNSVYNARDQLTNETSSLTGTTTYTYDANGSTISKIGTGVHVIYGYDLKNRLHTLDANGDGIVDTTYLYDDAGNKVAELTTGHNVYTLVDANNPTGYSQELEESAAQGGTPTAAFEFGNQLIAQVSGGQEINLLTDGHGNTRLVTDATGLTLARYTYDAYGNAIGFDPASALTSHLFTAEQFDAASGWYNQRARWYVSKDGTFSSADSYRGNNADPMSLHKYLYANGNPTNRIDPSGNFSLMEMVVNMSISAVLGYVLSPIIKPAISYVAQALLPQSVVDTILKSVGVDAVMMGLSGTGNLPLGSLPLGISGSAGIEVLWSPNTHNTALYGYVGGGLNLGTTKASAGMSGSVGLVWHSPSSTDYTKNFFTFSVPFAALQKALQQKIETQLLSVATQSITVLTMGASGDAALYQYEVATLQSVTQVAKADLANPSDLTANLFFWPGGAVGVSLSKSLLSTKNSSSNISFAYSYYWQLLPKMPVAFR